MLHEIGTFIVDADGQIEIDYLFDGGWFRGELGIFSLTGMEDLEPGTTAFIKEAARRALSNSEAGHILIQDEIEGAKFSADLPWERNFNTGEHLGIKTFKLTPGDTVGLMMVQHHTISNTYENPQDTNQLGKQVIFSLPQANLASNSPIKGYEVVDVNGHGIIAWEDVPIEQADKDYNDLIIDLQGLESNLPSLSENINPTRDWRKSIVFFDGELEKLSEADLVMHLDFDRINENTIPDSAPGGKNNSGKLKHGAEFNNGTISLGDRNDLVGVADSSDLNLGTHPKRTVSVWFKVDDKNTNGKQIIYEEGGYNEGDAGLNIYLENGRLYFGGWNNHWGNWTGTYLSSDAIYSDTWHHAVLVLDAEPGVNTIQDSVLSAYLDGVKIGEGPGIELTNRPDNIGLGGLNETTRYHNGFAQIDEESSLIGSLEDARIYNRALDASEVSLLFNPNHEPVAVADIVATLENSEVILFGIDLLANDTDLDGNELSLVSVENEVNGSASLNPEGNIVFTPELNFSGDASFNYTIQDGQGGTSSATVTVNVLPAKDPIPLGTNLHPLAEWSPQLPFVNAFKTARQWITQDWERKTKYRWFPNIWDTGEFEQLDLDENGWVKSIPAPEDPEQYTSVGTIMYRNVGEYPAGKYVVLYEGEGTITYGLDAVKDEAASTLGRDVIDVNPTNAGIWLRLIETDPNQTGNYIKNIKVVHEDNEYASEQMFNPEFLERIQPFDTLRFMDWMATNHSTQGEWSARPTPYNSGFFSGIASVEEMVELANLTKTNPWFNMPHQATDEYVTNFAIYVKDNLNPDLKVYIEYSNEVWGGFRQGWWVEEQGKEEFADSNAGNFAKRMDWFSKRTVEITQMWDEVYGEEKEKVVGVMGVQAANLWTGRRALNYSWTDDPLSHEEYGIDAIAIGPYFGRYLGKPFFTPQIEEWLENDDPNLALDNLFQEIWEGGVLQHAPKNGALAEAYDWTRNYVQLAEEQDLDLLAYEGSQHITGIYGTQYNQAVGDLFIRANRDPRMGELYQEYFTTLNELGVDLAINHNDVSRYTRWGSWGTIENIHQEDSAKYNAILSLLDSTDLPPSLGKLNSNLSNLNILVAGESLDLALKYSDVGLTDYHSFEFDWGDNSKTEVITQEPLLGELGEISHSHIYRTPGVYRPTVTVTDDDGLSTSKSLTIAVAEKLAIDWHPDSDSPDLDVTGNGNIKVAILGRSDFAPATIDPTTIRADDEPDILLDGQDVSAIPLARADDFRLEDTNNDGFEDLEITFSKASLRAVINPNAEPFLSEQQIYLFGSSSDLKGGFFLGVENLTN